MTHPVSDPIPAGEPVADAPAGPEVAALEAELASGGAAERLARYASRARTVARVLGALVVATGVLALVVGLAAFRHVPIGMVVVAVLCLPAIVLPLFVARRIGAIAVAAARPREVAAQAQDLFARVRTSPELRSLATLVARRGGAAGSAPRPPRAGKLRRAISVGRLATTVIGQAQPDEARHPLLVPFTPERLGSTWSAVVFSLWAWPLAGLVLAVSVVALLVSLV